MYAGARILRSLRSLRMTVWAVKLAEREMEYTVLVFPAEEGGYWVKVPALPGCYSQGESIEEALANAKEAIESHLVALKEEGTAIPAEDAVIIGRVKVAA